MSKKKKIIIISIVLVILLAIVLFTLSLVKDKSDSKKAMKEVEIDYTLFTEDANKFSETRDYIYENIFGEGYADNFKNNYSKFYEVFDSYKKELNKINKDSKNLKKDCNGIYYTSKDINTKCSSFVINYESINNYYVLDVKRFNILIKEYNKYLDDDKSSDKHLSLYKAGYKYLDFNRDNKYEGKE